MEINKAGFNAHKYQIDFSLIPWNFVSLRFVVARKRVRQHFACFHQGFADQNEIPVQGLFRRHENYEQRNFSCSFSLVG